MSKRDLDQELEKVLSWDPPPGWFVIGRPPSRTIAQLTVMPGIPVTGEGLSQQIRRRPGGQWYRVQPLYMLYVFRQNGRAGMIVNRVGPFQYEQMYLTEFEMDVVMAWAHKMVSEDIGRFTPADGGWMWWRK